MAMALPAVRIHAPAETVKSGEGFVYEVITEWKKSEGDYQIGLPSPAIEDFELLRQGESQETFVRAGETWIRKTFVFGLRPLKAGPLVIPAFKIPCSLLPGTAAAEFLEVPEAVIDVQDTPKIPVGILIAAFTAIAATAALVVVFLNRRRASAPPRPDAPASDQGLSRFQDIEGSFQSDPSGAILRLTSELRAFIGVTHKISGASLTDREMLLSLAAADLDREEQASLKSFFTRLEEAKFAGPGFSKIEFENLCRDIRKFIELRQPSLIPTPRP